MCGVMLFDIITWVNSNRVFYLRMFRVMLVDIITWSTRT